MISQSLFTQVALSFDTRFARKKKLPDIPGRRYTARLPPHFFLCTSLTRPKSVHSLTAYAPTSGCLKQLPFDLLTLKRQPCSHKPPSQQPFCIFFCFSLPHSQFFAREHQVSRKWTGFFDCLASLSIWFDKAANDYHNPTSLATFVESFFVKLDASSADAPRVWRTLVQHLVAGSRPELYKASGT